MSARSLTLQLLAGDFELRRPHSPDESSAVSVDVHEFDVRWALREAVRWRHMEALDLLEGLGLISPALFTAPEMMEAPLLEALRWGRLVLARPGSMSPSEPGWDAFNAFQARFGREFVVGMQVHRLVSRYAVAEVRREREYDVVPAAEAAQIVVRQGRSAGRGPVEAFAKTLAEHIVDLRTPSGQMGFVLLRTPAARPTRLLVAEEVMTPSKLKEIVERKEKGFIEVKLINREGDPVPGCQIKVEDADGASYTGTLDKDGFVRFEGLSRKGQATLQFSKLPTQKEGMKGQTKDAAEPSQKRDTQQRLVVVPGATHVGGVVDQMNLCCLYLPIMTVAFVMPEDLRDADHPVYTLKSVDGRYEKRLSPRNDLVPGDALLQLEFDGLLPDAIYDLEREDADGLPQRLFEGENFLDIIDQVRGEPFDRIHQAEESLVVPPADVDVGWDDDDDGEQGTLA